MDPQPPPPASPPPTPPPPPPGGADSTPASRSDILTWALIAAPVVVIVGAFLPWAKVTAPFIGTVTINGMDGDGGVTLLLGLVALALGVVTARGGARGRWVPIAGIVATALVTIVAFIDIADVERSLDSDLESFVDASVGFGLWLTAIGGIAGVAAFVALLRRQSAA